MGDAVPDDDLPTSNAVPADDLPGAPDPNPRADLVNSMASQPKIGDSIVRPIQAAASSMYHGVIGGYKGLAKLIGTRDPDAAADVVNNETSKAYSYTPPAQQYPDSMGPQAQAGMKDAETLPSQTALGDFASEHGASPGWSATLAAAPTALSFMAGTRGLGPEASAAAVPSFTPEEAVANTTAAQSMGARAVPPDLSVAPPELKNAIAQAAQKTGGAVHPVALDRHLDTAQLTMPEGTSPLNLRAGQATGDTQQISDEKNLRADPDTQGILSDSITDQDKKLVASMGEIRRQATPDIVQRTNKEHGQAAIDSIKSQDNDTVTGIRAKYQALADANGGDMPIDPGTTINNINARLKKGGLRNIANNNGVISEVMGNLQSGEPMDFETFDNARSRLAEVQRAGSSDGVAAGIVHDELNNMPLTPEAAPLRDLADTAKKAAADRFNTIKLNPAYDAAINDNVPKVNRLHAIGAPSPLADSFMDSYALGNSQNAAGAYVQRLKEAVPDPALSQSIEGAALNKLRDAAGIDPYGNGSFRNASYRNASDDMAPKADVLLSPQSIENTNRLKRVSGYVNDEGKASSVNRSNTALTLQRFGAQFPTDPTVAGQLLDYGTDAAAGYFGPAGVITKKVGQSIFKKSQEAKAVQSVKDAKLKFAQDATKPGAGLDALPPARPQRAAGGKVSEKNIDHLVERLVQRWKAAKKQTDAATKPMLKLPDATVVRALDIAGRGL
jgi:hypothetical protein